MKCSKYEDFCYDDTKILIFLKIKCLDTCYLIKSSFIRHELEIFLKFLLYHSQNFSTIY